MPPDKSLAQRKPLPLLRDDGAPLARSAARSDDALSSNAPPRSTRYWLEELALAQFMQEAPPFEYQSAWK